MKNSPSVLAALLVLSAPLPGQALTAVSTEDCLADLAAIDATIAHMAGSGTKPMQITDLLPKDKHPVFKDGYCVIPDIRLPKPGIGSIEYFASALRWQADWADASRPMPPNLLVIEVQKVGFDYSGMGDPDDEFARMLRYQARLSTDLYPNEFRLELAFDPQTDKLDIRQLAAQNAYANRVELTATLHDADLDGVLLADWSGAPPLDKLAPITIRDAELTVTNNGFFENIAMSWLAAIFPRLGDTPEAAVSAAQGIARDQISMAPDALVPATSKAALTALIDSVPHPLGTLRMRLDAPEGIQPSRIAATQMLVENTNWASFAGIVEGASLDAEWTPTEQLPRLLPPLTTD